MKDKVGTIRVNISASELDQVAQDTIKALEKKVKSLEKQLVAAHTKIQTLKSDMDLTKVKRDNIRALAETLVDELQDAKWVDKPEEHFDW